MGLLGVRACGTCGTSSIAGSRLLTSVPRASEQPHAEAVQSLAAVQRLRTSHAITCAGRGAEGADSRLCGCAFAEVASGAKYSGLTADSTKRRKRRDEKRHCSAARQRATPQQKAKAKAEHAAAQPAKAKEGRAADVV